MHDVEEVDPDYKDHDWWGYDVDHRLRLAHKDVPWRRKGVPNHYFGNGESARKWDAYYDNIGSWRERLQSDEEIAKHFNGPYSFTPGINMFEERSFAEMWDYNNNGRGGGSRPIMAHFLHDKKEMSNLVKTAHDEKLCGKLSQTIIQWLGTNCGSAFVDEARKLAIRRRREFLEKYQPEEAAKEDERKAREEQWAEERIQHRIDQATKELRQEVINKEKELKKEIAKKEKELKYRERELHDRELLADRYIEGGVADKLREMAKKEERDRLERVEKAKKVSTREIEI
jgi:hypothetical protein